MARRFYSGGKDPAGNVRGETEMGLWSRIKKTISPDRHSDDIQEELQFHLHMEMADGRGSQEARIRLGGLTRIK